MMYELLVLIADDCTDYVPCASERDVADYLKFAKSIGQPVLRIRALVPI
jgi:hypothetical protein